MRNNVYFQKPHTKSAKEEKITKKREEGFLSEGYA